VHPGCRLRASRICPILCAYPLPESPLRESVKMAFLDARIDARWQNDPCVHPFQKDLYVHPFSDALKINMWIPTSESETLVFSTRVLQKSMVLTADTIRVQSA